MPWFDIILSLNGNIVNKIAKIDNLDKWLHENRLLNTKEIKMNPSGAFFTYIFMI
jgi:hypothetical protein